MYVCMYVYIYIYIYIHTHIVGQAPYNLGVDDFLYPGPHGKHLKHANQKESI